MNFFPALALLFFLVPLFEIYLLIKIGGIIGAGPTVFLVVFTAVVGAWLLRQQGLSTFMRFQQSLARGQLPAHEMLEGLVLVMGGALLLTPGFFTDAIGFFCLLPPSRKLFVQWLMRRASVHIRAHHPEQRPGNRVFDGEYHESESDEDMDHRLR